MERSNAVNDFFPLARATAVPLDCRLTVSHGSLRNRDTFPGKPNEDRHLSDPYAGVFIIVDGGTLSGIHGASVRSTPYPNPSQSERASETFVDAGYRTLFDPQHVARSPQHRIFQAAQAGNAAVAVSNAVLVGSRVDWLENDLGSTCGIIGLLVDRTLHLGFLGDCRCVLVTEEVRDLAEAPTNKMGLYFGSRGKGPDQTVEVRRDIRNNPDSEFEFGSFTGQPEAMKFLKYASFELPPSARLVFATDGMNPLIDTRPDLLRTLGASELLHCTERLEGSTTDDKSVIVIDYCRIPSF